MTLKRAQVVGLSVEASPLMKASFLGAKVTIKIMVGKRAIKNAMIRPFNSFLWERSSQKISNAAIPAAIKPSLLVKLISPKNTMLNIFSLGRSYFSASSKHVKADNKYNPRRESLYWLLYNVISKGKAVTNTAADMEAHNIPVNSKRPKSKMPAVNRAITMLLSIGTA